MIRWLTVMLFALPLAARADALEDWVRQKMAAQREGQGSAPAAPTGALWQERRNASPLPEFHPPTSLAPLVKAVRPGVVNISTRNEGTSRSLGSGFVINADGYVVTNNHVVERAQRILVRLADGREFAAQVVGRDPSTDLALLRLEGAKGIPTVTLGDSDQLEIGDWVVAIGNPFGLDTSVTHGLISARERVIGMGPFDDFIQTNALINPGNSGGPLFDMHGDVVGVTTAIMSQGQGIGFAVPINLVKDLLPNLMSNGRLVRGWLGLNVQEAGDGDARVPVVVDVFPHSPAEQAGVRPGDRVVGINDKPVKRYQQLLRKIALLAPGSSVKLDLTRDGKAVEVSATLVTRPSVEAMQAMNSGGRVDALGLVLKPLGEDAAKGLGTEPGLRVEVVLPGGAAELGGVMTGDVVLEVNRARVTTLGELDAALAEYDAPEPVLVKFRRGTSLRYVALKPRP